KPKLLQRLSGGNKVGLKLETIPEVEKVDIPAVVLEDYRDAKGEAGQDSSDQESTTPPATQPKKSTKLAKPAVQTRKTSRPIHPSTSGLLSCRLLSCRFSPA
ncbi:MAG: hypothetical protein EAZ61_13245, partial [Oscillatoriales cyanobacterium]